MKYTDLAGRKLSNMTLGTVQLGMDYGIANTTGKPDTETSFKILDNALCNGVTSIDTAHDYGESEEVLGKYFTDRNIHTDLPFITTKLMTTLPAGTKSREIEREIIETVETSLQRMHLNKVDCIMLHRSADMTQHGPVVSRTLNSLIHKGIADYAGVSVYYPEEIDTMLDDDIYQAVQLPINLFDLKMIRTGKIKELAKRNITVFARSIFLQGLFFLDPEKMTDPDLMKYAKPYILKLRDFADRQDMSLPQFAVSFIRDIPGISSLVLGAEQPQQVLDDIGLLNAPMLSESIREEAEKTFSDVDFEAIMKVLRRPKRQL